MSIKVSGGGGGGGGGLPPGISGDGAHGLIVQDQLTAGDVHANADQFPDFHLFNGATSFADTVGNVVDADATVRVLQTQALPADNGAPAHLILRTGFLSGHQYTDAMQHCVDSTGSTAPLAQWDNHLGQAVILGQAGGIGLFGHAAPAAPRTLPQATIDAITDTNAKTSVQALANALADMGVLTLT